MTAHHRISGKPFKLQIAAFGEQILFNQQDPGTTAETRCGVVGRLLAWIKYAYRRTHHELQSSCDDVPERWQGQR